MVCTISLSAAAIAAFSCKFGYTDMSCWTTALVPTLHIYQSHGRSSHSLLGFTRSSRLLWFKGYSYRVFTFHRILKCSRESLGERDEFQVLSVRVGPWITELFYSTETQCPQNPCWRRGIPYHATDIRVALPIWSCCQFYPWDFLHKLVCRHVQVSVFCSQFIWLLGYPTLYLLSYPLKLKATPWTLWLHLLWVVLSTFLSFQFCSQHNDLIFRFLPQTGGLLSDVFLHLVPHSFMGEHQHLGAHFVMVEEKRNILIGCVLLPCFKCKS